MTDETLDVQPTDETQGEERAPRRVYVKGRGLPLTGEAADAMVQQLLRELIAVYPGLNKGGAGGSEAAVEEEQE